MARVPLQQYQGPYVDPGHEPFDAADVSRIVQHVGFRVCSRSSALSKRLVFSTSEMRPFKRSTMPLVWGGWRDRSLTIVYEI